MSGDHRNTGATSPPRIRRYRAVIYSLAIVALGAALGFIIGRLQLEDPWDHASGHLVIGGIATGLLAVVLRLRPRAERLRGARTGRAVLVTGLAVLGWSQGLEAAGAFGFDGYASVNALAGVHDFALYLSPVGMVLTLCGAVATTAAPVAARANWIPSRALVIGAAAATGVAVLFFVGGVIFGQ